MLNAFIFFLEIFFLFLCTRLAVKRGENFLAALICLEAVFANIFVFKQINLFGLEVTSSDSFAVGCVMSLGVFQEFFGKQKAQKIADLSLYAIIFCGIASALHLGFKPSPHDGSHLAYLKIFGVNPRVCLASLIAFYISQKTDIFVFSQLKTRFPQARLAVRSFISTGAAQILDTLCFTFLGLYGLVHNVFHIVILSFIIKTITIFFFSTCLIFFRKALHTVYKGA